MRGSRTSQPTSTLPRVCAGWFRGLGVQRDATRIIIISPIPCSSRCGHGGASSRSLKMSAIGDMPFRCTGPSVDHVSDGPGAEIPRERWHAWKTLTTAQSLPSQAAGTKRELKV